jgi:hypothetical protein
MLPHEFDISDNHAINLSFFMRPPRWRVFAYRRWRRYQQPDQIKQALFAAIRGEYEPLARFGKS